MKFFIDSADVRAIVPLMKSGVFCGVTTNPTILKNSGLVVSKLGVFTQSLLELGAQEVFFQSWGGTADELVKHGRFLFQDEPQIIVKLPCTREGLEAASRLSKDGIKTCITAVFAAHQALLAAATGATYVAPYLGRMNDAGHDGHALIAQMVDALKQSGGQTQILAASIRSIEDITKLAQNGVRSVTLAPKIVSQLFDEPLTFEATARFEADAAGLAK